MHLNLYKVLIRQLIVPYLSPDRWLQNLNFVVKWSNKFCQIHQNILENTVIPMSEEYSERNSYEDVPILKDNKMDELLIETQNSSIVPKHYPQKEIAKALLHLGAF